MNVTSPPKAFVRMFDGSDGPSKKCVCVCCIFGGTSHPIRYTQFVFWCIIPTIVWRTVDTVVCSYCSLFITTTTRTRTRTVLATEESSITTHKRQAEVDRRTTDRRISWRQFLESAADHPASYVLHTTYYVVLLPCIF
jgi:hypothetical protein